MRLRATIDKHLPVGPEEVGLSKEARSYAFQGMYMLRGDFLKAETARNYTPRTSDAYPYKHTVVRETSKGFRFVAGDSAAYRDDQYAVARELSETGAQNRVRRVERVARGIKLGVICTVMSAVAVISVVEAVTNTRPVSATVQTIENCDSVVQGSETLVPITTEKLSAAQDIGETVCAIATHNYLVVPAASK